MNNAEKNRKISKGESTRRRILDCAARLFAQHEFHEVTVDRIVEAAGVAKGTFYVHYSSKDELIFEFISDYVRRVDDTYWEYVQAFPAGSSVATRLLGLIEIITDTLENTIGIASMQTVYKLLLSGAANASFVINYGRTLYELFRTLIQEGQCCGELTEDMSAEELAQHCAMAIRGISYEWCVRYPDFSLKDQGVAHFRLLLAGIVINSRAC